jgi:hypothetical protein
MLISLFNLSIEAHSLSGESPVLTKPLDHVEVPISPLHPIYAKRSTLRFNVCAGGTLWQAAQIAKQSWNSALSGRVRIELHRSNCSKNARFRNGTNEISFGHPDSNVHRAVGLYMGLLDRSGEQIVEEDIIVHQKVSDLIFMSNILTHEFGHALGLNHALGATCREAVMAEYACDSITTAPTTADIAAAMRIYRLQTSHLSQFDLNNNGLIEDSEFFKALDQWTDNNISNNLFFDLVDAWISALEISKTQTLSRNHLLSAEIIQLFDLSGRFIGQFSGSSLLNYVKHLPRETYIIRSLINKSWQIRKIRMG